jgi:uncharacterized protein YndB with AHSA1/START domain
VTRTIAATPLAAYRALLDPEAVAAWQVPDDMTAEVHRFEPVEGGAVRISLTYRRPDGVGKTSAATDTYHGTFTRLVPDHQVVELVAFETTDPDLQGEMTVTTTLTATADGVEVAIDHDGIPPGVDPQDNEVGTRMSLDKLAALLEPGA